MMNKIHNIFNKELGKIQEYKNTHLHQALKNAAKYMNPEKIEQDFIKLEKHESEIKKEKAKFKL